MNKLQKQSLYGSHMPILARVMDVSVGPVLELGMGLYSTPLLDLMCREEKRRLVSLDNDPEWFDQNKEWESDYHVVQFVEDWEKDRTIEDDFWGVAFVDEKPAKNRMKSIKRLANRASFIVVHDTEPESDRFFKYSWIWKYFTYRFDYTSCRPHTTVLSNFIDLGFLGN